MANLPPFLSALLSGTTGIPREHSQPLADLLDAHPAASTAFDAALAFALGAPSSPNASPETLAQWTAHQKSFTDSIAHLIPSSSQATNGKRAHPDSSSDSTAKRIRTDGAPSSQTTLPADPGPTLLTFPSLSATSPIRKKIDVHVHASVLRLVNPSTGLTEASLPLSAIQRAFLLPTRGKTKAHWSVLLLPADVPPPAGTKAKPVPDTLYTQVGFGVDALAPAPFSVLRHGAPPLDIAKGAPARPALDALLALLPVPALTPSGGIFASATFPPPGASPALLESAGQADAMRGGTAAYRGAKPGALWFFDEGMLWAEARPAEFWALERIVAGAEGVRLISATGRTCAIWVRRRVEAPVGEEEEEEETEETEFGMIEGKEQEPIRKWVRRVGAGFGLKPGEEREVEAPAAAKVPQGKVTMNTVEWADDEEGDDDFVGSSDEEGGSGSGEESAEEAGSGEEDAEGTDDEEEGGEEEEEEELDPANHPLLREGAMPKRVRKAARDMVVAMVVDDVVGGGEVDELDE